MDRDYTPIPNEWAEEMEELSDEEFGRLVRACINFCMTGEETTPTGNERFYSKRAMNTMRRFNEGWEDNSIRRKAAAQKAAAARWHTEADGTIVIEDAEAMPTHETHIRNDANACERIPTHETHMRNDAIDATQNQNQSQSLNQNQRDNSLSSIYAREDEAPEELESTAPARQGAYYALPSLPKWVTVDNDVKDEVTQIAKDIYTAYVPGKQVNPGICISLYNAMCEVDRAGKVYVSNERVNILKGAYLRAKQMGKPGNWNVVKFVLQKSGVAV